MHDTGLGVPPIPQLQALGQQVVERLRTMIVSGEIRPGTRLVESQLSTSFGVSRGPIRDALSQLQLEGLVEGQGRGVRVRGLTEHDIDELYSLREAIEVMALRKARADAAPAWSSAQDLLQQMKSAADRGDHETYAHADLEFHGAFYDIAGHSRLKAVWGQYSPTFRVLLELTNAEDIDLMPSYDSHVELFDQVRAGNIEAAVTSLRSHLLGSRARLVQAYAREGLGGVDLPGHPHHHDDEETNR